MGNKNNPSVKMKKKVTIEEPNETRNRDEEVESNRQEESDPSRLCQPPMDTGIMYKIKTCLGQLVSNNNDKQNQLYFQVDEKDGFEWEVEPRSTPRYSWDKLCIWCGLPLLVVAIVAVLIGQFSPVRETVVRREGGTVLVDRQAEAYNQRLEIIRLAGLGTLLVAALIVLLGLLLAAYGPPPQTVRPEPTLRTSGQRTSPAIPLTASVARVQPSNEQQ